MFLEIKDTEIQMCCGRSCIYKQIQFQSWCIHFNLRNHKEKIIKLHSRAMNTMPKSQPALRSIPLKGTVLEKAAESSQ